MRIPAEYIERCYAGWLGKIIGVRHGASTEGMTYQQLRDLLGEITYYPAEYNDFAADDDTNGPLFFLRALMDYTHTRDITAEQMGLTWLNYAPYEHGFYWWGGYGRSTEHTAYLNLRAGIPAPRSGSIAQNGAAIAEQIGGQIFIDTWGLSIPANPALAAEYAAKAASVSHDGNGIYGGQFVAAAISAAFVESDIRRVLEIALEQIPADCEYTRMVKDIFAFYDNDSEKNWHSCMNHIIANWGYDRYPGVCHIIPNSAVMVMSMLYGEGDFTRTINICHMGGWDTDCNVGNVGAILGVLVGLDGIEGRWRDPIHDFLAASSVVGCLNIMEVGDSVRMMANLAYKIADEEPPEKYRAFLRADKRFDFALPGSACSMRVRQPKGYEGVFHEDAIYESGNGGLRVPLRKMGYGNSRYVYYGTYYRPKDFTDSRYNPAFSPLLYPGQTISARVCAAEGTKLHACMYVYDGNTGREYLGEPAVLDGNNWTTLKLDIPALSGACIEQAGVKVTALPDTPSHAALYMDWMDFTGKADYTLDFAKERMEIWTAMHREVSQMTYLKGVWELNDGRLMGTCADYAEAYTGDIAWGDVEVTCTWEPAKLLGRTGFALRVQGAIRGYAVWVDRDGISIAKNDNGYDELACCALPDDCGDVLTLTARAVGNEITVSHNGRELLQVTDNHAPYLTGMVGLVLSDGGHADYDRIRVKVL